MTLLDETYTKHRQEALPARTALAAVGFAWHPAGFDGPRAHWTEAGFDLTAGFAPDPGGWFAHGVTALGHFTDRRAPQAVPHHRGGRHSFRWFVPVDPAVRHAAYRRACEYGEIGCYRLLIVRVARAETSLRRLCGGAGCTDGRG
jgi:hypothetical protein